jgi:hypothetical protein
LVKRLNQILNKKERFGLISNKSLWKSQETPNSLMSGSIAQAQSGASSSKFFDS